MGILMRQEMSIHCHALSAVVSRKASERERETHHRHRQGSNSSQSLARVICSTTGRPRPISWERSDGRLRRGVYIPRRESRPGCKHGGERALGRTLWNRGWRPLPSPRQGRSCALRPLSGRGYAVSGIVQAFTEHTIQLVSVWSRGHCQSTRLVRPRSTGERT
ncbi:hypothetical protein C8Q77DRAFT_550886 [Trametes polyzona]|nr:hypothetical protein C8Q77DRAFT_550722 [Trametes polyzona]KAI0637149.1 hypothetical protein C8Q77DRAFT_550808 [Trametes polyzona]KAI0637152.1 hypothetical protein C8Q77DRAFT_550886 [Trametes polyzona]